MAKHVSAREARARFAEITDRVRYTGEAVIVEKQGQAFVAVVSLEDFALLERLRRDERAAQFSRLAAEAAAGGRRSGTHRRGDCRRGEAHPRGVPGQIYRGERPAESLGG